MKMLNIRRSLKIREGHPPKSNDPDLRQQIINQLWRQRNDIDLGRAICAWAAIVGWALVIALSVALISS